MNSLSFLLALLFSPLSHAEDAPGADLADDHRRYQLSTSAFVLVNLLPNEDPPEFAQLNFGFRLTDKDVLTVQAITWRYGAPLGIPYGRNYGNPDVSYPGTARDVGVGVAYQRYLWKGLYVGVEAMPFVQVYLDEAGKRIQTGFQLFCTARVGYHIAFANNRVFLEPSLAATAWPINTNLPDEFQVMEDQFPSYFLAEPGLHFGVKF